MNLESLAGFVVALAQLSWRASWLIVIVLAVRGFVRGRIPAGVWFGVWIVVALRLLVPFSVPSAYSPFNLARRSADASAAVAQPPPTPSAQRLAVASITENKPVVDAAPAAVSPATQAYRAPRRALSFIEIGGLVWAVMACGIVGGRVVATSSLARKLRSATDLADPRVPSILAAECRRLGIARPPRCLETDQVPAPALFGLARPRVLFPSGLVGSLSEEELRLVLLHELGHLRRRDLLAQAFFGLAVAVHWFNPLVWMAARAVRTDCELACDAFVLRRGRTSVEHYGATLLRVLGSLSGRTSVPSVAIGIGEGRREIAQRVAMIARFQRPLRRHFALGATVLVVLAGIGATREAGAVTASAPEPAVDQAVRSVADSTPGNAVPATAAAADASSEPPAVRRDDSMTSRQLADEQRRLDELNVALKEFRLKHGVLAIDDRRDALNANLKNASFRKMEVERALQQCESRLALIDDYRKRGVDLVSLPFIGDQPLVREFGEQSARVRIELAMLQQRYGEKHPEVASMSDRQRELAMGLVRAIEAACERVKAQRDSTLKDLLDATAELARASKEMMAFEQEVVAYKALADEVARQQKVVQNMSGAEQREAGMDGASPREFAVSVIGAVNRQSGVGFGREERPIVLDAIARAGGFAANADRTGVRILRLDRNGARARIDLSEADLMAGARDASRLTPGDVVIVPEQKPLASRYVTVLGAVNSPGRVVLPPPAEPPLTLLDLLGRVGGANRVADLRRVSINRVGRDAQKSEVFALNLAEILSGKVPSPAEAKRLELEPGDVVNVPERQL